MFRLNQGMQHTTDAETEMNIQAKNEMNERPEAQLKQLQRQRLQHAFENRSAQERARKQYQQLLLKLDELHLANIDNLNAVEDERAVLLAELDAAQAIMQQQHVAQKQLSQQLKQLRERSTQLIRSAQFAAASHRLARANRSDRRVVGVQLPAGLSFS